MVGLLAETCSYKNRVETAIWAVQILLLSAGVISTVAVLKGSVIPYSLDILGSTLPSLWSSSRSWLSPPYIYIILNFIIITIAASSTFHAQKLQAQKTGYLDNRDGEISNTLSPPPPRRSTQTHFQDSADSEATNGLPKICEAIPEQSSPPPDRDIEKSAASAGNSVDLLAEKRVDVLPLKTSCENDHREYKSQLFAVAASDRRSVAGEMKTIGVGTPKSDDNEEGDTMETTWTAITEQGRKAGRQLKKSDTWDVAPRVSAEDESSAAAEWRELRKSGTYKETMSATQRGGLRRDPSLSQDELNRRVEAFINKFNQEMRLQRQESDQRFLEMINRGV